MFAWSWKQMWTIKIVLIYWKQAFIWIYEIRSGTQEIINVGRNYVANSLGIAKNRVQYRGSTFQNY